MRLTQLLFRPKRKFRHMGFDRFLGRGRNKVVILFDSDVTKAKESLDIEEENMLYLRHPYLTFEQSFRHVSERGFGKSFIERVCKENFEKKRKPDIFLEDRYSTLRKTDVWDS